MKMKGGSLCHIIIALVAFGAVIPSNHAQAGLLDDWFACKQDVLPRLRGQSPSDAAAQYCMGLGYMTGQLDGKRDRNAAAQWFARAAAQGHAGAEVAMGYDYEKGYGVVADPAQAVAWYRKAAAQNNADGLFNLGRAYQNGIGVAADTGQARTYYSQAAAHGSPEARQALDSTQDGYAQAKRSYDAKNYAEGSRQMLDAANAGNAQAQFMIGNAYEFGNGVAADLGQAASWYQKAASQGHAEAQKNLGNFYEDGRGVPEDWTVAVASYRKSAEQHNADGEFALGRMYEFGMAVPQDRQAAIRWFRMAGDQGNAQAAYFAKWLSDPTNNIGFRSDQEHQLVIGSKLRFAGDLTGGDPAGIAFRNSTERMNWLNGQRQRADYTEAHTMWQLRKDEYDSCMRGAQDSCHPPGPAPSR
jgi:TPR repeat protein